MGQADSVARIFSLNAISNSTLSQDVVTETALGAIPAGTFLNQGMSADEILQMAMGATPTTISIYMGALTNKPTSMTDIPSTMEKQVVDTTLLNTTTGYVATIKAGDIASGTAQYPFIALPHGDGTTGTADYTVLHWYPAAISAEYEKETITTTTHTIYYLKYPTYDVDLGGNQYRWFIKKTVF